MRQNLERLVSCHQLISYPSESEYAIGSTEHTRTANILLLFLLWLMTAGGWVKELYNRSSTGLAAEIAVEKLYFSVVPSSLISSNGPYFLTDICAVVKK